MHLIWRTLRLKTKTKTTVRLEIDMFSRKWRDEGSDLVGSDLVRIHCRNSWDHRHYKNSVQEQFVTVGVKALKKARDKMIKYIIGTLEGPLACCSRHCLSMSLIKDVLLQLWHLEEAKWMRLMKREGEWAYTGTKTHYWRWNFKHLQIKEHKPNFVQIGTTMKELQPSLLACV